MRHSSGVECLNPYIGLILKADDNDLIADEMYRASVAIQNGAYDGWTKSKEYCEEAANDGYAWSQYMLADAYYYGIGVDRDVKEALK